MPCKDKKIKQLRKFEESAGQEIISFANLPSY